MKEKTKSFLQKTGILSLTPTTLLRFFAGLAIIQLAVASFLQIGIGSDSFTVFMQGLSKVCSVSVGTANFLLTLVLLIIVFLLDRTQFKIGMVFAVAFAGLFLDGMAKVLAVILPKEPSIPVIALEFALTCVVVSIGFPLLKSAGIGSKRCAVPCHCQPHEKALWTCPGAGGCLLPCLRLFLRRRHRHRHRSLRHCHRPHDAVCDETYY